MRRIVQSRRRAEGEPIRYPGQQGRQAVQAGWAAGAITLPEASWAALQELAAEVAATLPPA